MYGKWTTGWFTWKIRPKMEAWRNIDPNQTKPSHPSFWGWQMLVLISGEVLGFLVRNSEKEDWWRGSSIGSKQFFWHFKLPTPRSNWEFLVITTWTGWGWYYTIRKIHPSSCNERHMICSEHVCFFWGGKYISKRSTKKWDFLTLQLPPHTSLHR